MARQSQVSDSCNRSLDVSGVQRLKQDGDWVRETVLKHSNMVFRIAFTHTKSHAESEDVLQEVFIKLFGFHSNFKTDEDLKAWLIRVTINTSLDLLKSAWRKKTVSLSDELPLGDQMELHEGEVTRIVKTLPVKYRSVIYLFYYEGMSITEISKTLKIKEATIKTQLSRAKNLLKNKLEGGLEYV